MDKKGKSPWSIVVKIIKSGVLILVLAGLAQLLWEVDTVHNLLMLAKGIGICAGVIVLGLGALAIYYRLFPPPDPHKVQLHSDEYPVRCYLNDVPNTAPAVPAVTLQEGFAQAAVNHLYLVCALTNYGINLSEPSAQYDWKWIPTDNIIRFSQLSPEPCGAIILPMIPSYQLYYVLDDQAENLACVSDPPGDNGYTGSIANLPAECRLWIRIIFTEYMKPENLKIITRELALNLKLVVLDRNGQENWRATRQLYDILFQFGLPSDDEEDYSWLYHSRPIFW
jgi:hypothetical protein